MGGLTAQVTWLGLTIGNLASTGSAESEPGEPAKRQYDTTDRGLRYEMLF